MKATFKRTAAAAMSVLMVALAVLTVPTLNAKAFDNSVKQGVIAAEQAALTGADIQTELDNLQAALVK